MKAKTQFLYFGSRLLCGPLEAMYALLIFILSKELNGTLLQLTILAAIKPFVSLFAFYLNTIIIRDAHRIRNYLLVLNIAGCLPCLLFPLVQSSWYYIASYLIFMIALRSSYPAWIEILRTNLGLESIRKVVARGSSIHYSMIMIIPFIISPLLDHHPGIWKTLFFSIAFLQLLNTAVVSFVHVNSSTGSAPPSLSLHSFFSSPWKNSWGVCTRDKAFSNYLAMFFLGGAGLVALQPILPVYFKETLHMSYQELAIAISLCKGISFVLTSPLWARWTGNLYSLNACVNLFSCLFIAFLLASSNHTSWIFAAYLIYGIMQSGCEFSLNVSGPLFSKNQESTSYSGINLALLGIRGCLFPVIGQFIFVRTDVYTLFMFSGVLCFLSALYALFLSRTFQEKKAVAL